MKNKKIINLYELITINELSLIININYEEIINFCKSLGIIVNLNTRLEKQLIILICNEFNIKVKFIDKIKYKINNKKNKIIKYYRSPIISIMGHVDHGKTSFLDYIRKSNIIYKEYGNITQHIGIYNVNIKIKNKNNNITFIDTPGHESFLFIRRVSVKLSDIALIIISCESGVMKQTIESIEHARSENLSIIFAFNKIDKFEDNIKEYKEKINNIKKDLSKINILVKDWGGKYLYEKISVKTGYGINELINKILKLVDNKKLLTNLNEICSGRIIESYLDKNKGNLVKILVIKGILKKGDYILSGIYYGKIKIILNERNKIINKVYPSYPAIIIGINGLPISGEKFYVINNKKYIKKIINKKKELIKEINLKIKNKINNNDNLIRNNKKKNINIILKVDVDNSLLAIKEEINKINNKNNLIRINIIKESVGNITQEDILLSETFNYIILGFNIKKNIKIYKNKKIYIFNIIYKIIEFLKNKIKIILYKKEKIKVIGRAKIIKIFNKNNINIFGGIVIYGKININYNINVIRNDKIIYNSKIKSLKIYNDDVKEVKKNNVFGIILINENILKKNDIIENYK
ncbi:MAG: hypothetical protein RDO_1380 [Flavobacteriales endosymbiont of Rhyzopertha dominica]|nr:MAG: translation initiation factor IF-2 [Candidatus Shikimatogenerans bostrichidophilus]